MQSIKKSHTINNSIPPQLLVVDDAAVNLRTITGILATAGFRILTARNGLDAYLLAKAEVPDLILLDVVMPGESGFETCARLKSDPQTANIPVLFLSALDDVKSKVHGLKIGGVDFISKPVNSAEVLARVRVHLRISDNNSQLIRTQRERLESLREAQQAILVRPEDCPEASFAVHFEPLDETGGDFYDVIALNPELFGYFVADVSGHGASAAFLTSALKALLRQYSGPLYSPEDTMRGIGSVMAQMMGPEQYITACYVLLNRRARKLCVVSAGHPPLILVNPSGEAKVLEMSSEPLGIFSSAALHSRGLRVCAGDRIYLYSDGLVESKAGAPRKSGLERLVAACREFHNEPLLTAPSKISARARENDVAAADDVLLLAVEVSE